MPPIAHSRYAQSCKLAFALAESIAKHEPIEEKHYWKKESKFKGVKEHGDISEQLLYPYKFLEA